MKRISLIFIVLLLLAVPTGAALAAPYFDQVVHDGDTINNDVIIFDGDLEIHSGGTVNGDVVVFNGDTLIAGTVNGDLVIFNGDLEAEGSAHVNGDCVLLNGQINGESAGSVGCTTIQGDALPGLMDEFKFVPPVPPLSPVPPTAPALPVFSNDGGGAMGFFANVLGAIGSSLLMGVLAFAVASLFPSQLQEMKSTVHKKAVASGAVGLLTAVAVPSIVTLLLLISVLLIIVCIGLIGFPIALVIMLAFIAAITLGWITVGTWLGGKIFRGNGRSFAMVAALGTILMTLVLNILGMIPFVFGETILMVIISCVGLGAVTLTKFGMKPYPPLSVNEQVVVEENSDKVSSVMETLHIDVEEIE